MASKKPKRSPVRKTKSKRKTAKTPSKRTKIKKDPLKEYAQSIKKDGVVEVLTLADDDCLANVKMHISTQSLELDRLLNNLGIPCGRVTELFGAPHIGKTTTLDHIFAEVQKMGGVGIVAEPETARDIVYSRNIGVDADKLQYLHFPREEFHLENILMAFYRTIDFWRINYPLTPVVLGLDALGGASTRDELKYQLKAMVAPVKKGKEETEEEKKKRKGEQPAQAAKVLRKACRQLPPKLANTNIAVVICNHEYELIRMGGRVGKKRETYGGDALRHLASLRVQLFSTGEWLKKSDGTILGRVVGARLVKNRLGNPWGEARMAIISGAGINNTWSVYKKLKTAGIITGSGSWAAINLDGELLKFQGWMGLQKKCDEDPTLFPRLISVYRGIS